MDNNGICIIAGCGKKVENPMHVFCEKHRLEAMGIKIKLPKVLKEITFNYEIFSSQDMTKPTGLKFKTRNIYKWPWIIQKIYYFWCWIKGYKERPTI